MTMRLGDDGTLDTVIVCSDCGEEFRFNFDHDLDENATDEQYEAAYDEFVAQCKLDAADDHECPHAVILKWCQGGFGKFGLDVRTPCMRHLRDGKRGIVDVSRAAAFDRVVDGDTWGEVLSALRAAGANIPAENM